MRNVAVRQRKRRAGSGMSSTASVTSITMAGAARTFVLNSFLINRVQQMGDDG
jgi:hypothetical protein